MKKFVKISLIVVGLLIVIGGGTLYYFFEMKDYDVADEEVDKVIEDPYSIEFPEGTPLPEGAQRDKDGLIIVNKEGDFVLEDGSEMTVKEWFSSSDYQTAVAEAAEFGADMNEGENTDSAVASAGSNRNDSVVSDNDLDDSEDLDTPSGSSGNSGSSSSDSGSSSGSSGSSGGGSGSGSDNVVTVETIKSRYASSFNSLAGQAEGNLGSLISQAKSEYANKKSNGENINYAYFYQKYSSAAESVEAKTDAAFNSLYAALETELTAHGYSASHAESFRTEYESTKKNTRNAIMDQVSGL